MEEIELLISRTRYRQDCGVMCKEYYDKDGIVVYSTDRTSEAFAKMQLLQERYLDSYLEEQVPQEEGFFKRLLKRF